MRPRGRRRKRAAPAQKASRSSTCDIGRGPNLPQPLGEGQPRDGDAAELPLQGLEQGHDVPHREDVVRHKCPKGIDPVDLLVDRVARQGCLEWREAFLKSLRSVHRGFPCVQEAGQNLLLATAGARQRHVGVERPKRPLARASDPVPLAQSDQNESPAAQVNLLVLPTSTAVARCS
jgi:hypothetical protein